MLHRKQEFRGRARLQNDGRHWRKKLAFDLESVRVRHERPTGLLPPPPGSVLNFKLNAGDVGMIQTRSYRSFKLKCRPAVCSTWTRIHIQPLVSWHTYNTNQTNRASCENWTVICVWQQFVHMIRWIHCLKASGPTNRQVLYTQHQVKIGGWFSIKSTKEHAIRLNISSVDSCRRACKSYVTQGRMLPATAVNNYISFPDLLQIEKKTAADDRQKCVGESWRNGTVFIVSYPIGYYACTPARDHTVGRWVKNMTTFNE